MLIKLIAKMDVKVDGYSRKVGHEYEVPPRAAFVHVTPRADRGPIAELKDSDELAKMLAALKDGNHTPMLEPLEAELERLLGKDAPTIEDLQAGMAEGASLETGDASPEGDEEGDEGAENDDGAESASDASDAAEKYQSITDIRSEKKDELVKLAASLGLDVAKSENKGVFVDAIAAELGIE